ncbi:MAG: GNAT family N-acetyltransferase [Parasphingopyxis sp.]|nr:GNAT family N-acetyltransferase [Sphingomonadales bacterium]
MTKRQDLTPASPLAGDLRPEEIDALADDGDPRGAFLRHRWFAAGKNPAERIIGLRREDGTPAAAIPLSAQKYGPLRINAVSGGYWPFRGFPVRSGADRAELAEMLCDPESRRALGGVWRVGPVFAGDATAERIVPAARDAGWQVLTRSLGTIFELDLAALRAGGDWPSAKTQRKNRWRKRRLAEDGEVVCRYFTGADWTKADRDAMAEIEANSWLAKLDDGGDTKFRDPAERRFWEDAAQDPALATMIFGSLMSIGETPAAFTFGIEAGDTRYYIANNYDERFTKFGPGRVLLYDDFERAAEAGITRISWGVGDAGYKSEMGAEPGPVLLDLLFVRGGWLAALLEPIWARR